MNVNIEEIENELLKLVKKENFNHYIKKYRIYSSLNIKTSSYLNFKCIALLYYLATNDTINYFKLIQSVKIEETEDECLKFIIKVSDLINAYDINELNNMLQNCSEEFEKLLQIILKRLKDKTPHDSLLLNKNDCTDKNNYLENIKDCMYICKNHHDN